MKLIAFRIQNFQSIKDTGWCRLSNDEISCLIGQNEAGKTAILKALEAFYEEDVSDEFIRSDDPIPIISCTYEINPDEFSEIFYNYSIPEIILNSIAQTNNLISISMTWRNSKCEFGLAQEGIIEAFREVKEDQELLRLIGDDDEKNNADNNEEEVITQEEEDATQVKIDDESRPRILNEKDFVSTVYSYAPKFVLFEDFSSLLPHQINMIKQQFFCKKVCGSS